MKNQLYSIISVLAIIAYFIPMLIVLFKKLWRDNYFLLLAIYWIAGALSNIVGLIPGIPAPAMEVITVIYNMFDIPFILAILWYTTSSVSLKKFLLFIIAGYVLVEVLLVSVYGITFESIKYILGAGVLVVLITLVWEITLYMQRIEHTNRERSMLFIYAALLFEYGSYSIVYTVEYFVLSYDVTDTLLIYYVSTLIAILIASFGFLMKNSKDALAY